MIKTKNIKDLTIMLDSKKCGKMLFEDGWSTDGLIESDLLEMMEEALICHIKGTRITGDKELETVGIQTVFGYLKKYPFTYVELADILKGNKSGYDGYTEEYRRKYKEIVEPFEKRLDWLSNMYEVRFVIEIYNNFKDYQSRFLDMYTKYFENANSVTVIRMWEE